MPEKREHYDNLLAKIRNLGDIKDVLRNETRLKQIIAYPGDRHLLCAFADIVNEAIIKGDVSKYDLEILRSGKFMDMIVNLEQTINEVYPRQMYTAELLDKINYVSLIQDPQTLAASYTHPTIIDALCGKADYANNHEQLVWWRDCGTFTSLPSKVQSLITFKVIQNGNLEAAKDLLCHSSWGLEECSKEFSQRPRVNKKNLYI